MHTHIDTGIHAHTHACSNAHTCASEHTFCTHLSGRPRLALGHCSQPLHGSNVQRAVSGARQHAQDARHDRRQHVLADAGAACTGLCMKQVKEGGSVKLRLHARTLVRKFDPNGKDIYKH